MKRISSHAEKAQWSYLNTPSAEYAQLSFENDFLDGRKIKLKGQDVVHFGNCSYLGLDTDERLKIAAISAISRFGVQFSSSRSFVSVPLYDELESLLGQMFGRPAVVTASTSLGHLSAIPVYLNPGDAALIDSMAHASLWTALQISRANGVTVQPFQHNNINALEEQIKQLKDTHQHIWIVTDGLFSMAGDTAHVKDIIALLNRYENVYLYIDDAHGMSWTGKNGCGFVKSQVDFHEKMMLAVSLNKSFGGGGGALILPNEEMRTIIKRAGPALVYAGPVQPSALAAGIESAKIHLSPEITARQRKLKRNINHFIKTARDLNIKLTDWSQTPIFFVHVGEPIAAGNLVWKLRESGYYVNPGLYPAVAFKESGLRISLNWHHSLDDITGLLTATARLMQSNATHFSAQKTMA
jgi:7-keto-8-aminopelargonate synthetase-like enzyme